MFLFHLGVPSVSVNSVDRLPTGLKIILKCIDLQWLRGGGAVVSAATSRPEGSGFEPEGQCGINICYVGPIIHLTFNAHEICPALLNHCKIHSYQLDLERRKPRNRNQTFSLTLLYVVRVPIYLNTPNSIWHITLCHNAPQHTINQNTFVGHLQPKHIYFSPNSGLMQCN